MLLLFYDLFAAVVCHRGHPSKGHHRLSALTLTLPPDRCTGLRHHPKRLKVQNLLRHEQNGGWEAPSTTLAEQTGKIAQLDGSQVEIPWRMALSTRTAI